MTPQPASSALSDSPIAAGSATNGWVGDEPAHAACSPLIKRHRTAMHRVALSRPIALACDDGLLRPGVTMLDYGCGRGGDVRRLASMGVRAHGWDPAYTPKAELKPAAVVNLGYVVNVIEDPGERMAALHAAWAFSEIVLIVAARLEWELRHFRGRPHGDGWMTTSGTFQKLFSQDELRTWIDQTLDVTSIAAAPGIYYVFRDGMDAQRYLANRIRLSTSAPKPLVSETLFAQHRSLFDQLGEFVAARGRLPRADEWEPARQVERELGSVQRAFSILRRVTGAPRWDELRELRTRDLLVYLALANFSGRPAFSQLPRELQYDVRDLFGSYKDALARADELLFQAGDRAAIDEACRQSGIGKLTPEALYVHVSAVEALSPVLRVYEGCARALTGNVDGATVLKLHRIRPQVSYLEYPRFEKDAHPALASVVVARLSKLNVSYKDFRSTQNPPILHRKEAFVTDDHPLRKRFADLTAMEERLGLFAEPSAIGTRAGWEAQLTKCGAEIRGHRASRARTRPAGGDATPECTRADDAPTKEARPQPA